MQLNNVTVEVFDATQTDEKYLNTADVVIMDPPRTGSTETFLKSVVTLGPRKVVYVSCGPDTLARDLKYLTRRGYHVEEITPFDLFPFTRHVECVVLLSRAK